MIPMLNTEKKVPSKELIVNKIPQHVAIIMDGNGRWAELHGNDRIFGHRQGVEAVRSVVEGAGEIGISYLTLYAFSTENWNRPKYEIEVRWPFGQKTGTINVLRCWYILTNCGAPPMLGACSGSASKFPKASKGSKFSVCWPH